MTVNAHQSKLAIGQSFVSKYGQRFTITGFSKDLDTWEPRVEFYEIDERDKWGEKYSEPLVQFENKVKEGKLNHDS